MTMQLKLLFFVSYCCLLVLLINSISSKGTPTIQRFRDSYINVTIAEVEACNRSYMEQVKSHSRLFNECEQKTKNATQQAVLIMKNYMKQTLHQIVKRDQAQFFNLLGGSKVVFESVAVPFVYVESYWQKRRHQFVGILNNQSSSSMFFVPDYDRKLIPSKKSARQFNMKLHHFLDFIGDMHLMDCPLYFKHSLKKRIREEIKDSGENREFEKKMLFDDYYDIISFVL